MAIINGTQDLVILQGMNWKMMLLVDFKEVRKCCKKRLLWLAHASHKAIESRIAPKKRAFYLCGKGNILVGMGEGIGTLFLV